MRCFLLLPAFAAALFLGVAAFPAGAVEIVSVTSPGGIEAWLVEDHTIPVIALEASFQGGSSQDPAGREGVANAAADLLTEGAGDLDSQSFQQKLLDAAVTLGADAGLDNTTLTLRTLSARQETAWELATLALTRPRFDTDAMERQRAATLADLRMDAAEPQRLIRRAFYEAVFAGHPYSRDSRGTPESVAAITADDLRAFVAGQLSRDRLLVAVTGDITPAQLAPVLDRLFGALPARGAARALALVQAQNGGRAQVLRRSIGQTVFLMGQQGVARADPDWFPAYVMNYILGGGGFVSRLTEEVREKRGLTYGVYSHLLPLDAGALIVAGGSTRNATAGEALKLIREEWRRMAEAGVTDQELADAKTYLTGSFPLQFSSSNAIARIVLQVRRDGLGIDYLKRRNALIESVTRDDVLRVARRLLNPETLAVVAVGDPQGVEEAP